MARGKKREASPVAVEEEAQDEVMQDATNALKFNEPLTWRAGRPIAVSDLLQRLKTLQEELQSLEQEDADRETLVPKAQELANVQLLGHKDKGVKAWTILCIVEMFRLLAPDAPYKGGQLRQIFDIFVSTIVPALASPSDPYSQQHLAILTSLTKVKSIVLLTDLPGSDNLILNLFSNCFDVISGNAKGSHGEQLSKNVEYHMTDMLCTLVDESDNLPTGVTDIVLSQFLRADPTTISGANKKTEALSSLALRGVSPAYNMARAVCNTCGDKMARAVGQYFSGVLIDASETFSSSKHTKPRGKKRTYDESEDESDDGMLTPPAENDLQEVEKAHRLLRELWRSAPDVVQNIIPQMEAEVAAENVQLRTMAVQTVGDMIAGIGAAGPPPSPVLNPAADPSQSLELVTGGPTYENALLTPAAPHVFSSVYPTAYQGFVDRHRDKSAQVRSAWATAAGRVVSTSGGGKGLDSDQQTQLLRRLSDLLVDQDEKVRLAAVHAVGSFDYHSMVQRLGSSGGVNTNGSVLCNLADRIKDPKQHVRVAAIELLGRIWGVAAGAIAEGSERVRDLIGSIPSRIFMAVYINNPEVNALVHRVMYDSLLPVTYPPIKPKPDSQRVQDSQNGIGHDSADPDTLRAERILVLVRDLEDKAKKVFFALLQQQAGKARYFESLMKLSSELYSAEPQNEEVDEKAAKKKLNTVIDILSKLTPDSATAAEHLRKFAKHNDRRSFQLIRFCYSPDSDYRKVFKAMKELSKRMEEGPNDMISVLDTLRPLLHTASILVYNRSHVPAIMNFARTDDKGLGQAAHEVLKQISTNAPDVFKVHVRELCDGLRRQAPTVYAPNSPTAVDELKACAGFASRFPDEMPKDREFYKAMSAFAMYGVPPEAAKHAVTVIVSAAEKREMYIHEILKYSLQDFKFGANNFLSRLAAVSQLRLVANKETDDHSDAILEVAANEILGAVRTAASDSDPAWSDEIDDDLCAKLWALRILVNGVRGMALSEHPQEAEQELGGAAANVYRLLNTLISNDGELSTTVLTPEHHKAHLRLAAANQMLKLSCRRATDHLLTARDFNHLAKIAQDPLPEVRAGFLKTLKKYLGQEKLPNRFYALIFLYAFEPTKSIKESITTWLKSRAAMSAKRNDTTMESVFARLLSLLAHHPDFEATENAPEELEDFVDYIMFYLKTVATEANLPLIYHVAQRIKSVQDGIDPDLSDRLYVLSDMAESVIRHFQDIKGWSMQLHPGKVRLPTGIFAPLPSHELAQEISEKRYLPDDLAERMEDIVKGSMKSKKRKADNISTQAAKKAKATPKAEKKKLPARKAPEQSKVAKTPKKDKKSNPVPSSERRKSARTAASKNYAENDDSEDDEEMDKWQSDDNSEGNKENISSSTPPTSDPMPIIVAAKQEKAKAGKKQPAKKLPQRSTRATKSKREKDVMDVPSDSEDELSEPPSEMEA